ncbi:PREDICTED: cysteine-rich protein 2 isoform X2 [Chinchilla lanigera]|uniref:Cysteine-rich protein 2 n=1 Tax=Chinchilla lanigera TaxID=34839 RepID=A0A8C2V0C0_CHILA|nr:PREDICTED: cysteine-rich protein 2 isoform X2 [Chinchilla lanigera]
MGEAGVSSHPWHGWECVERSFRRRAPNPASNPLPRCPRCFWNSRRLPRARSRSSAPQTGPRRPAGLLLDTPLYRSLLWKLGNKGRRRRAASGAEKVSSLGKDWHKFCLKCERCSKTLTPGGHAEHDGKPFCHKPCYATLFGPKGVNIGGAGSYIYEKPVSEGAPVTGPIEAPAARAEERKASGPPRGPSRASSVTTFTGEPNVCPRCNKRVYFAEKVTSLGKDWHRPCLRCERCAKTLTPGGHAEHDGQPYCHKPCYGILFGPKGVNTGAVGSYIYDRDPEGTVQP